MASSTSALRQVGIYRNLPIIDDTLEGLAAIVTGANGISGFNMMRALLESPKRWKKVFCLSRRPPPEEMMALLPREARSRIHFVSCDFLSEPASIAEALTTAGVHANYIFFYSYVHKQWSEADALVESNVLLLQNFLQALELAKIKPDRFILQTGGKNYGVHIGRTTVPLLESDPQPKHLEPSFYYIQEDLVKAFCQKQNSSWSVIMPCAVIGASSQAAMNGFYLFGVYAAVQTHKGEPLEFGGDWESWQFENYHCSARMTGFLTEWVALTPHGCNEKFNTQDGGPLTLERFFNELARWYGASGVVPPPDDESDMANQTFGTSGKLAPLGYGPPLSYKARFTLEDWAKDEKNVAAWREMMEISRGKLIHDPFAIPDGFYMARFAYCRTASPCLNKARRLGWTGFVDTMESIFEAFVEMAKLGMLPEMRVQFARPLC
ncbi:hypothetical protein PFICI_10483 [Pestalotiopsis fici W106-1]|uniref:PRISE-like Rossmann-fold domain-containing protein n=1 Tax=Pestalotiopsis fici (strain W106-1 / CGMCC3.15140) TaxID=1229662 RepID=W3WZV6_PESFW|nr:uncharacterized protein PFICI_10483 [Pestalotiopsis fici W106-1]ETS78421.1 hypothetical protein PFICI_10483 [Pestalotiopsis fici W106-1]